MEILDRYVDKMHRQLHTWAEEHTASHPRLVLLDIDPEKYPHQHTGIHTIKSTPLEPQYLDPIAQDIDNRYDYIPVDSPENEPAMELIGEILDSRQNIVLGTDHMELVDIALLATKVNSQLHRAGYMFDSAIIVNKMIAYLGVDMQGSIMTATEVLGQAFDEIYLSIPHTSSAKGRMSLPKNVITNYNDLVIRHGIEQRLKKSHRIGKAVLLAAAFPGTVNKELDVSTYEKIKDPSVAIEWADRPKTLVIGRANTGMLRFTAHALSVVACSQLDGPAKDIQVHFSRDPLSIRTKEKLDKAMGLITEMQNLSDPEHNYVYDVNDDLPVVKPQKPNNHSL